MYADAYKDAGELLRSALRDMVKSQSSPCQMPSNMSVSTSNTELLLRPIRIDKSDCYDSCSSYSVYNRALLVLNSPDHSGDSRSTLSLEIQVSAVLLYNLGLFYQTMDIGEDSRVCLALLSLQMYDIALFLLSLCTQINPLLRLALENNKGYILSQFCEFTRAHHCLFNIQRLLTGIHHPEQVQREDILEIRMNVVLLLGFHTHSAAA
jgi:hypothetical protein